MIHEVLSDDSLSFTEKDVVIAGYGCAGAAAAITAHDAGADVTIVERMSHGGGNTLVSMGGFLCPRNAEDAIRYIAGLYDFSHSDKDEEMIRVFAQASVKNVDWVKELREGTDVQLYGHAGYPDVPGAESMDKYLVKGKGKGMTLFARNLWDLLSYAVQEKRKIPVLTHSRAIRLLTDSNGEVTGIVVARKKKELAIRARRAVVLSTGGYEFDMKNPPKTMSRDIRSMPPVTPGTPVTGSEWHRKSEPGYGI